MSLGADGGQERERIARELTRLYDLTVTLRDECPWDRKQSQEDIITYTLEEVYELADALAAPDPERHELVRGELGDLLFQVYFLARVAEQAGWYSLADVASGIHEKLVRRHPHIFGDASAETAEDVRRTWDEVKKSTEGRQGIFHEVPESFPATLYAQKVQQRAATAGFDWEHAAQVLEKIREETDEIVQELAKGHDGLGGDGQGDDGPGAPARGVAADADLAGEVGDLLFAVVNLARKLKVDPELELRGATHRFRQRVLAAERLAEAEGEVFEEIDLERQEAYFQRAKRLLREGDGR